MANRQYDEALAAYEKTQKLDPTNPYINISLSDYYRKQGDDAKALEYLKLGFSNPNLDIDSKINILLVYYSVNEIYSDKKVESFELSEILIKCHPEDPKAWSIYGDLLYQDERYEDARTAFRKVITIDSSRYLVWEQLLFVESQLMDFHAMKEESDRALNLFPQQPMIYLFSGVANYQLKDYRKSVEALEMGKNFVVGNNKMLSQFYSSLGDGYFQLKEMNKAYEAYEAVLKIDPDNSVVLNNYAYYLSLEEKDLDKAEKMAKRAVELDPENGANQDTYGWVLYQLGRYNEAKEWIGKAIKNREESAVVIEHYGDVLWKLGEKEEAVKYWERAAEVGEGSEFLEKKVKNKALYE
jgi:tetratricopeptide (TPR) repeat protein